MYLFLDDIRYPRDVKWVEVPQLVDWNIVRNYNEFVNFILKNGLPKFITFDHDLCHEHQNDYVQNAKAYYDDPNKQFPYDQFKEKTGYHCAKWLVEYCLKKNLPLPEYQCHSMNHVGKQNILSLFDSFKKFQSENSGK